jgi:hypothetical protein
MTITALLVDATRPAEWHISKNAMPYGPSPPPGWGRSIIVFAMKASDKRSHNVRSSCRVRHTCRCSTAFPILRLHSRKHDDKVQLYDCTVEFGRDVSRTSTRLWTLGRASPFIEPQRACVPIDWRGSSTPEAEHRRDACRRRRHRPMLRRLRAARTPPMRKPG